MGVSVQDEHDHREHALGDLLATVVIGAQSRHRSMHDAAAESLIIINVGEESGQIYRQPNHSEIVVMRLRTPVVFFFFFFVRLYLSLGRLV